MPKPAKVLHHVKGLVASLSISEVSDANIDSLVRALCSNFKEYTLEPQALVRDAVITALPSALESNGATSSQPPHRVMSLNQMVSTQYLNMSSKRYLGGTAKVSSGRSTRFCPGRGTLRWPTTGEYRKRSD